MKKLMTLNLRVETVMDLNNYSLFVMYMQLNGTNENIWES